MTGAPTPRTLKPRNIAVTDRELAIAWADGHESYYPFAELRRDCPCAGCRARPYPGATTSLKMLQGPSVAELKIERMLPIGTYAVQIVWSDGHDSGIYAFESLRRACPCKSCAGEREATPAPRR